MALARYGHLTAAQATRLLYGAGSLTYAQARLKQLADAGYALRVPLGRPVPHGSGPLVYSLDRRGRAHLAALGIGAPRIGAAAEERARSASHLAHALAVVDVLILHELLTRGDARCTVARVRGERELAARPVRVAPPGGVVRGVAPDAWVDLRIAGPGGTDRACIAYEVDRGTEWQGAWRGKVDGLLALASGPYREAFGTESLTIAVVAPEAGRVAQLLRWTEAALAATGSAAEGDLFRFGTLPADPSDARAFFRAARWSIPGRGGVVPLL